MSDPAPLPIWHWIDALAVLSAQCLRDVWEEMGLSVADSEKQWVQAASREAYDELLGPSETIYDIEPRADRLQAAVGRFEGLLVEHGGKALADRVLHWCKEQFISPGASGRTPDELGWESWLYGFFHGEETLPRDTAISQDQQALLRSLVRSILLRPVASWYDEPEL
jgi:hypothetical protein